MTPCEEEVRPEAISGMATAIASSIGELGEFTEADGLLTACIGAKKPDSPRSAAEAPDADLLKLVAPMVMRQGQEIGKSVRAGMEDEQPEVHSELDATADTHTPSHVSNTHEQFCAKRDFDDSQVTESIETPRCHGSKSTLAEVVAAAGTDLGPADTQGAWHLGPRTWNLGPGTWDLGPRT